MILQKKINEKLQKIANNYNGVELDIKSPLIIKAIEIMENDFSTANLLSFMLENLKLESTQEREQLFKFSCEVFGLVYEKEEQESLPNEIMELVEKRAVAKKEKDFDLADTIRTEIENLGYEIKDTRGGIKWKKIKK